MSKKWIAFFSQTGTEILDISRKVNYFPDVVVTNNKFKNINPALFEFYRDSETKTLISVDNIDSSVYTSIFESNQGRNALITLNGWLKIIPADICKQYTIYNGHPGIISLYKDLKGKDPVERVWENYHMYDYAGCVIHKVIPEIDEGEIISEKRFPLADGYGKDLYKDFDSLNDSIRRNSLGLWVDFIRNNIII